MHYVIEYHCQIGEQTIAVQSIKQTYLHLTVSTSSGNYESHFSADCLITLEGWKAQQSRERMLKTKRKNYTHAGEVNGLQPWTSHGWVNWQTKNA